VLAAAFLAFALALFLHFAGYHLALAAIRHLRPRGLERRAVDAGDPELPRVAVVVPVFEEAHLIGPKLANLLELEYARDRLRIIVVDGRSTDSTPELVRRFAADNPEADVRLVAADRRGKVPQINSALSQIGGADILVVTDADCLITTSDALLRTVGYLRADADVALVGGWAMPPPDAGWIVLAENAYWDKLNRLRYAETVAFSSSIVVAPYYAFRSDLLRVLPDDCIADDVYASFEAHTRGRRVVYAPDVRVTELRQPRTLRALYAHKRRKTHAYTIELLRVAHKLPAMSKRVKLFYGYKLFQFFYLPWAAVGFAVLAAWLLLAGHPAFVAATCGALTFSVLLASLSMTPAPGGRRGGLRFSGLVASAVVFVVMFFVLMANFFGFPFRREDSCYSRVGNTP
jgi:cellulose synthase/poly-beta-1,6-N-acetylglucosamine synthase-like glycosyltransferase